ncbi:MAG: hypothetical protein P1U50_00865 [Parvibaculaceae bacterium]|nr:hypothetical protein [Parvibaculaceae bacterium]
MKRAINAARRSGLTVSECRIEGGAFRVICTDADGTTFEPDNRKPKEWTEVAP